MTDGIRELTHIDALLFPENYPPGDPFHDPEHVFWQDDPDPVALYEWSSGTTEFVAAHVRDRLADLRAVEGRRGRARTGEAA